MKNILALLLFITFIPSIYAQSAKGIAYQSVIRDTEGEILANATITIRFTIQQATSSKTGSIPKVLYCEEHTPTSDTNGIIRVVIGEGKVITGSYASIDWGGKNSIKTEIKIDGSDNFNFVSEQELASVPYALSAETTMQIQSANGTKWGFQCDNEGKLQTIAIPSGFSRLVFSDEFNGTGLPDSDKWGYEEGYVRNGELQYYTVARQENCYLQDGHLHIVCRNDSAFIENALIDKLWEADWSNLRRADTIVPITSASICTQGKFAFTYGYVEVRAKLPVCLGSWPAIWLMPQDGEYGYWPNSGEIDIMEHVGYDPSHVYFTLHSSKWNGSNQPNKYAYNSTIEDAEEWHTYALEWYPDRISWYLDGEVQAIVVKGANYEWQEWPFKKDFYLILNFAFGGGWGGREGVDLEALPREYIIDYVRIFQ